MQDQPNTGVGPTGGAPPVDAVEIPPPAPGCRRRVRFENKSNRSGQFFVFLKREAAVNGQPGEIVPCAWIVRPSIPAEVTMVATWREQWEFIWFQRMQDWGISTDAWQSYPTDVNQQVILQCQDQVPLFVPCTEIGPRNKLTIYMNASVVPNLAHAGLALAGRRALAAPTVPNTPLTFDISGPPVYLVGFRDFDKGCAPLREGDILSDDDIANGLELFADNATSAVVHLPPTGTLTVS